MKSLTRIVATTLTAGLLIVSLPSISHARDRSTGYNWCKDYATRVRVEITNANVGTRGEDNKIWGWIQREKDDKGNVIRENDGFDKEYGLHEQDIIRNPNVKNITCTNISRTKINDEDFVRAFKRLVIKHQWHRGCNGYDWRIAQIKVTLEEEGQRSSSSNSATYEAVINEPITIKAGERVEKVIHWKKI